MKMTEGKISWQSPSNIALVKYWGKKGLQVPANPSVSMTLRHAVTTMALEFSPRPPGGEISLEFYFEGRRMELFDEKIRKFLWSVREPFRFLKNFHLKISSENTFPHSAGIASSASSMSALALCLLSMRNKVLMSEQDPASFLREASYFARLASGSACRSVYGGFVSWGASPVIPESSDKFASPLPFEIHPVFQGYRDSILVVREKEKDVSSRAGHSLMEGHPYARSRYALTGETTERIIKALRSGDLEDFVRVTEWEALNLHALMMTSRESYLLLEPGTLSVIKEVRSFRHDTGIPVCFTLDAGPNIHLLYPASEDTRVKPWISERLMPFAENGRAIHDECGTGPLRTDTGQNF
jgi:diphosphomevalonate decarboxylase